MEIEWSSWSGVFDIEYEDIRLGTWLILILIIVASFMEEKGGFQFGEQAGQTQIDLEFKKQRAAYLAQRNARKKEAETFLKKDRGHSTSSDEDPQPALKQPSKFKAEKSPKKSSSSSS